MSHIETNFNTDLIRTFANCKVLVIGDLMLDQYWWGTVNRISPEAPVPVIKLEYISHTAGGAANVAANIVGLGAEALLVGAIGKDVESQLLAEHLNSLRIDLSNLTKTDRPTSVKTRIVAHSQHVVRVDREDANSIGQIEEKSITDSIKSAATQADVVILSDYAKGTLTKAVIETAIEAAAIRGIPVLVDPKGKDFSKYRGASMITPNRKEAIDACRLEENQPDVVTRAGTKLINDLNLDAVVITEGERGMTIFERDKAPKMLNAVAHEIYDVTGAGDTVIACLAVALAAKLSRYDAVRLANIAAGLVVEQVGTTAITLDALVKKITEGTSRTDKTDAAQL